MAECLTPIAPKGQLVPCGKCPACTARRTSQWSFRLMQQDKHSISSLFLTLTYESVPRDCHNRGTLRKRDCQLFFKRLRKAHPKGHPKLSYYLVGEYGDRYMRPHYHCILFNADIRLVQDAWGHGHVHYGFVSGASIGYTLKYICKVKKVPQYAGDARVREFALISKGIGLGYLSEGMMDYHLMAPEDHFFCTIEGGRKIGLPRYYKLKLFTDEELKAIGVTVRERCLERQRAEAPVSDWDRFARIEYAFRKAEVSHKDSGRF